MREKQLKFSSLPYFWFLIFDYWIYWRWSSLSSLWLLLAGPGNGSSVHQQHYIISYFFRANTSSRFFFESGRMFVVHLSCMSYSSFSIYLALRRHCFLRRAFCTHDWTPAARTNAWYLLMYEMMETCFSVIALSNFCISLRRCRIWKLNLTLQFLWIFPLHRGHKSTMITP